LLSLSFCIPENLIAPREGRNFHLIQGFARELELLQLWQKQWAGFFDALDVLGQFGHVRVQNDLNPSFTNSAIRARISGVTFMVSTISRMIPSRVPVKSPGRAALWAGWRGLSSQSLIYFDAGFLGADPSTP
jgi:hypothetical protein